MKISIPCKRCFGSGHTPVTGIYYDTLMLCRDVDLGKIIEWESREMTAAELAKVAKCKPTAMSNRLANLERMGLMTSRRCGVRRFYRVKE
jgi:DNA-binding transcriptional ArsR family regulator